jgi:hypothetical protein
MVNQNHVQVARDRMERLTKQLGEPFSESKELEAKIRANLGGLGFEL